MTKKQQDTSRAAGEKAGKIAGHKKSVDASSSRKKTSAGKGKNIQKAGTAHDDWNDPTGNSHMSSSNKGK